MNTATYITPPKEAADYAEKCLARFLEKYEQAGGNPDKIGKQEREVIYYHFLGIYMREGKSSCDENIRSWRYAAPKRHARGYC